MSDKQMAWAIVKPNGDFVLQTIEVGEDESWDAFVDNCGGFVMGWKQDGYSCQRVTISIAEQRDVKRDTGDDGSARRRLLLLLLRTVR